MKGLCGDYQIAKQPRWGLTSNMGGDDKTVVASVFKFRLRTPVAIGIALGVFWGWYFWPSRSRPMTLCLMRKGERQTQPERR